MSNQTSSCFIPLIFSYFYSANIFSGHLIYKENLKIFDFLQKSFLRVPQGWSTFNKAAAPYIMGSLKLFHEILKSMQKESAQTSIEKIEKTSNKFSDTEVENLYIYVGQIGKK